MIKTVVFKETTYKTPLFSGRINRWATERQMRTILRESSVSFFDCRKIHIFRLKADSHIVYINNVQNGLFLSKEKIGNENSRQHTR